MQNGSSGKEENAQQKTEPLLGRGSFSQVCYHIVETYSRDRLTIHADKLIALKDIQDEVAFATGFTYMYGLWRESLVMNMLWFAIEGPGRRSTDLSTWVAPTWLWASINTPLALDLLPEHLRGSIKPQKQLVSILKVCISGDTCTTWIPPN
ncbi:hypothetical protein GGR58DRAFT_241474 [Xylaria digitata]|nr:hypothetical protein GGR58DRAFT_241474 [Xylaria digitata]